MPENLQRFRIAALRPKIRADVMRNGKKIGGLAFHNVEALKQFLDQIPYKANEKVEFTGQNFSGADLAGVDFQMCYFRGCNFSNAKLQEADFTGCLMQSCDFTNADMRKANLEYAEISASVFTGANVEGVDFGMTYGSMAEPPEPKKKKQPGYGRHLRPW